MPVFGDVGRPDLLISDVLAVASGADGTMWALAWTTTQEVADAVAAADMSVPDKQVDDPLFGPIFIRYRDGHWSAYPWATVSPEHRLVLNLLFDAGDLMVVDDRGVLWFVAGGGKHGAEVLASFDGETARRYPAVTDIGDLSIDTEGRPRVVGWDGLQVITPEAVAATE